jgi:predicted nucleotidyltransferase
VRLAIAFVEPRQLLAVISRSNRSVEFYGHDDEGDVMVTRRFANSDDEAALSRSLALLAEVRGIHIEVMNKAALRDRLAEDDGPRLRALQMTVSAGSVDRSFPDRMRHGDPSARPLGQLHPSLPMPSKRRLQALARRYHLRRITAFGSGTRADFRSDSDLDLVVEPRPGRRPRLSEMARLSSEVEDLFGRDVDLLAGPIAADLRARIDRDAVILYQSGR